MWCEAWNRKEWPVNRTNESGNSSPNLPDPKKFVRAIVAKVRRKLLIRLILELAITVPLGDINFKQIHHAIKVLVDLF